MRIVLLADGAWGTGTLVRFLADEFHVVKVITRRRSTDPDLLEVAAAAGVPVAAPPSINDEDVVAELRTLTPDLLVSMSYDQILRRAVLDVPRVGAVNGHAGMLPLYRGRNVVNWALINGESEIGLTAHFMDEGIDTGDIILQRSMPVSWTDTYGSVLPRLVDAFPPLMSEAVTLVQTGEVRAREQRHERGTYFAARREGDEWIDWSRPSVEIYNKIRAITRPGPGARTRLEGRDIILWSARYDPNWPEYRATPGEVVARWDDGVAVKTGDSTIDLLSVRSGSVDEVPSWRIGTRFASIGPGGER